MSVSLLKLFSTGVAAENKALRSRELKVTPTEALPFLDGEIREAPTEMGFKGLDETDQVYEGTVFTDNVITATWLPRGSNRVTPPDIRRGERIDIWRVDGVDKYYWSCQGLDDHLRKLETVVFAISGNPNEGSEVLDVENCYFLEWSTHTKQVTFQTSKKNGEPYAYTLQFNTDEGRFMLQDDDGQEIILDSEQKQIKLINTMGTMIEINKKNINVNAVETLDVLAGTKINLKVGATELTMTPAGTVLTTPNFAMKKG